MPTKGVGCSDTDAIEKWLSPFITDAHDISYPACREMKSMIVDVLKSEKYENLMRQGKVLSNTWNFNVTALAAALGKIAKDFGVF